LRVFVFVWVFALFFEIGFCCNVFGFCCFYKKNSGCGCLAWVKGNEGGSLGFLRLRCFFFPLPCARLFVCFCVLISDRDCCGHFGFGWFVFWVWMF
jgi:hypothetical protein